MTDTPTRPRPAKVYTMADLQPIIDGKVPVPNLEEMPLATGLSLICLGGWRSVPDLGRALVQGTGGYGAWARYFLASGQGGGLTGEGVVIWSQGGTDKTNWQETGRIAKFAICRHKFVEGPGANHSRGWHPGACGVCGLDMSVDSGD